MTESENESAQAETAEEGRTRDRHSCRRCDRNQGLVGKYDINLCRQCFREVARDMGFKKYS